MSLDKTFSITELAQMIDIKEPTLRKYQKDYNIKVPKNELGHRYYTDKEIEVFKRIKQMKESNFNIHQIKKLLDRSVDAIEQNDNALELVTLDKLTGVELKSMIMKQLSDLVLEHQEGLKKEYETKLEEAKKEIKEELKKEFQKQHEQILIENQKLIEVIQKEREEKNKGFFKKLFGA